MQIPFFASLQEARCVLIAGCGGGFDIFSGLPLYVHLRGLSKTVHLANLSFTNLRTSGCETIDGKAWLVNASARQLDYFPERLLAEWLRRQGHEGSIIAFDNTGVRPLHDAYRVVVERFGIDTVVLIDGGTDSIIKGDEPGLGTVTEDATSLVAVNELDVPRKLLACLGFGIDHFHGISHHSYLENTAELIRLGGFMGNCSVTADTPEGRAFLDAVDYANMQQPHHRSIVCNSISSAIRGEFGDYQTTGRTAGSQLFVNPLMPIYWFYNIAVLAKWIGFYDALLDTNSRYDVLNAINDFREQLRLRRLRQPIPL